MEKPKNESRPLKINSTRVVHKNPWFRIVHNRIRNLSGTIFDYFSMHTNEGTNKSVLIIAVEDDKMYMVKQYRFLLKRWVLEVPGGGVEPGQSVLGAAKKELLEELGVEANRLRIIGKFAPWSSRSSEICYVVSATKLDQVGQRLEKTEEGILKIIRMDIDNVLKVAKNGKILCGVTLAAIKLAEIELLRLDLAAARKNMGGK